MEAEAKMGDDDMMEQEVSDDFGSPGDEGYDENDDHDHHHDVVVVEPVRDAFHDYFASLDKVDALVKVLDEGACALEG